MRNHVSIHFKLKDRMFSITLKTSVEDTTLSMIEERMYKKLGLDESKEKLELSYMPLVVGCETPLNIVEDEDLFVYLTDLESVGLAFHSCNERRHHGILRVHSFFSLVIKWKHRACQQHYIITTQVIKVYLTSN